MTAMLLINFAFWQPLNFFGRIPWSKLKLRSSTMYSSRYWCGAVSLTPCGDCRNAQLKQWKNGGFHGFLSFRQLQAAIIFEFRPA
ncbi:hypothetical protein IB238_12090 [Rhizobium sp. ARZ01]|uniref:hypothetical protein n=1 Tax=Rhizobium sp. ARZ01 TaxID=2769313 RepID=UPI0017811619|nr:hypothetical protein [Rhizobium sp. ARZ01]MBD9373360.1 hypothetical protein [Rhizobium sp. ARZ01]